MIILKIKKLVTWFKHRIKLIILIIVKQIFIFFLTNDSKIVLFGAHNGVLYGDNSCHIFEWVLKERPDINAIWITRDNEIYKNLKGCGKPVVLSNSIHGVRVLAKAKVALYTNSLKDIAIAPFFIPKKIRLIALRHGKSIKKVRFAREKHKISKSECNERKYEGKLIKYVISTSDFISDIQEECMRVGKEKHIVTGYPRNDYLVNPLLWDNKIRKFILKNNVNKKLILYAPTWRHGRKPTRFLPFDDFNKEELNTFLQKNNLILLIRPHKNDLKCGKLVSFLKDLSNNSNEIKLITHKDLPDVNLLLPFIDIMVTDYSSIYHDFLLLDRPIIFIPYDYKDYEEQNGFFYDYFYNLPGPAVGTLKEFCDSLTNNFNSRDIYKEKRRRLRDQIHTFKDAGSCNRVMILIDKLLNN